MVKYLLSFFVIFFLLPSFSWGKNADAKLKSEYGTDLTHAPFVARFAFQNKYGKDWKNTSYDERKDFLSAFDAGIAQDTAEAKADARAEANKEKQRLAQRRAEERKERDREKAEAAEEKADQSAQAAEQKAFRQQIKGQERQLQQDLQQMR